MGLERGYIVFNEDAESRTVGRVTDKTAERLVERRVGDKKEKTRERGREKRSRKVETTCRNNVRVFDLRHVTEPH